MKWRIPTAVVILWFAAGLAISQNDPGVADHLKQHYEAAQDAQAAGDLKRAEREYQEFLSLGLHRLADHRLNTGDFTRAASLFGEGLRLMPDDIGLQLGFAEACLRAGDRTKAKVAAEHVLTQEPKNAQAHFLLGRVALETNDADSAKQHLELAVQLDPTYEHGFTLATAYLKLRDPDHAAIIFSEMVAGFGDTASIRMEFGRAYAQAGYPERAVPEFKAAIAKDDKFAGAHYSLGAAYLVGLSDAAYPEAAAEFRIELRNHPDDLLSLVQLGTIALSQHNLEEAEKLLSRASSIDPKNPDSFLGLGQIYAEQNRQSDGEAAFRKSIALTSDVSRNHYQVQRAHYQLGRLLAQTGRQEEAKQELKISDQLLKQSVASNQGREAQGQNLASGSLPSEKKSTPEVSDPEAIKTVESYEAKLSPALADAYNNLGVFAASQKYFASASDYFQQAAIWNPSLPGVDSNLAHASFSAGLFDRAVPPLTRSLKEHPDDTRTRSALGSSLFHMRHYHDAVLVLRPLESKVTADPRLNYIYAVCLVRSGEINAGMNRLQELAKQFPKLADVHAALGEGFVAAGESAKAAEEYRLATELNPADADTKYRYALSLIALQRTTEARAALADAIKQGTLDGGAYYELGKLQLESGDANQAITTLELGTAVDPENASVHCELAAVYRRGSRADDAEREKKTCQALESKNVQKKDLASRDSANVN